MSEIVKQLGDVTKHMFQLLNNYPAEILRGGFKGAYQVERYHRTAQALGVSREDAEKLLVETREELSVWWCADSTAEAERRLMEQYAALLPLPPREYRDAALRALIHGDDSYTPEDVDRLARHLQGLRA